MNEESFTAITLEESDGGNRYTDNNTEESKIFEECGSDQTGTAFHEGNLLKFNKKKWDFFCQ